MRRLLVIIACLSSVLPAHAASFDCAKAVTKVEKLVCADPKISKLDDELGKEYQAALRKANDEQKQRLVAEQKHWLKHSRDVCRDETCIKHAYWERLAALVTFFEHAPALAAKEPVNEFCAEIKKKMHTIESSIKGAGQTFYKYSLDKYNLEAEGSPVEKFQNLDFDGDDQNDLAEKSCSASTVEPSDPCVLSVKLSSGKEFYFEGWDIRLIRYHSNIYLIAHHDDESRYKLFTKSQDRDGGVVFHPEVAASIKYNLYWLNGSGTTLICENL